MKKTIVVFGATGGIGAYTVDALVNKGYEVIACGKRKDAGKYYNSKNIKYYPVDISCPDLPFINLPVEKPEAVIHLAGMLPARMSGYNPNTYIDSIIKGTLNVLDFCVKVNAEKIIYSHSISDVSYLYDTGYILANSESKFPKNNDHSIYAIAKMAAVNLIEHYYHKYNLKRFVLRLPNVYLYHPNPYYFVNGVSQWQPYRRLIQKAITGETIEVWGDPNKYTDIFYVKDLINIFERCILSDKQGGLYNAGTGNATTLIEQIKAIVEVFTTNIGKSEITFEPRNPSRQNILLDVSQTIQDLGYMPEYDNLKTWQDFKKEMIENRFSLLWQNNDSLK